MVMTLYVVFDRVAQESMPIFETRNDGTALRMYQKAIMEADDVPDNEMMLLKLGTIDHDTNLIELEKYPVEVMVDLNKETE